MMSIISRPMLDGHVRVIPSLYIHTNFVDPKHIIDYEFWILRKGKVKCLMIFFDQYTMYIHIDNTLLVFDRYG